MAPTDTTTDMYGWGYAPAAAAEFAREIVQSIKAIEAIEAIEPPRWQELYLPDGRSFWPYCLAERSARQPLKETQQRRRMPQLDSTYG